MPYPEDVQEPISEDRLAKICVDGMQPTFKPHLVAHHFPDFSALYEAARNLNETVEPPLPPPRYQHSSCRRHPASEAQAFLDAWVQDGKVILLEARKEPTRRDMEHSDYCIYHRMVYHPTKDCWGLRTLFEKFMVEEAVELTATKDVLRNPLPNHKDNGKAVMMEEPPAPPRGIPIPKWDEISKEGSPSTGNPNEKKRAIDAILAKARAPAEDNIGPKVVKYTRPDAKDLPEERKKAFIALIREYIDVFAWNYDEMPRLDPGVTTHKLNVVPSARPVKQGVRSSPKKKLRIGDPISNELKSTSAAVTLSNLKHFTIYQGVLYYRGSGGLLAWCIGEEEAKVSIWEVHERSCRTGDVLHDARPSELEALEERRDRAQANLRVYQRRIARAYNALVRLRQFPEGDLVLKAAPHVMKGKSASKFAAKWEGPFVVKEANENGYH
ncbi:hypothetical protein RHSIM_Rhsim02G0152000 [Rhododendron simsii]|uniref:Uncharacterized protein n=1 Tax=Rhododendron simsii TaxID=118357 RepID=A0A834LXB5_RHOSS|nr:hypothetical protein RHSIM_Rhsim02G0152000 [Rhododendron simsii]